jgi:thioredoxin-related protein
MDRKISLHRRILIAVHLMMCKYCRRLKKQLLIIKHAVRLEDIPGDLIDRSLSLSKETRERIKQAMRDYSPDPDPDLPIT